MSGEKIDAFPARFREAMHDAIGSLELGPWSESPSVKANAALLRRVLASEFVETSMEWNRLRDELSAFKEPTTHVKEWTDLSHRHTLAEKAMRETFRRLQDGE